MSLFDPFVFTVTGSPVGPTPPPELRVLGGEATPTQIQMAQQAFVQFCSRARLSVVPNPREAGRLPDGSRYEIVVVGKAKTMLLWPVGGGVDGGPFIAWTAFFNTMHFPIWERPVVDFPYDDLPPKPEPPGPEPAYPPLAEAYFTAVGTGLPVTFPVGYHHVVKLYIGWGLLTDEPTLVVEGSWIITEIGRVTNESGSYGYYQHVRNNYYSGGDFYESVTVRNPNGGSVDYSNTDIDGSNSVPVTPTLTSIVGLYEAAAASAAAYNAAAISSWTAAHAAWVEESLTYADRLAEWNALREELLALQRPWWPVLDIRKAARPVQVQDVKEHLLTGIGDRHLTARILSFPYNVAFRTVPPVGSGGSITHEWVVEPTQRGYKTTLVNAEPYTTWPVFEEASAETYPAHPLRRDFMPPECLFGWKVTGEMKSVDRFYAEQRAAENFMVEPTGFAGLFPSYPADYFTYTRVTSDPAPGLVVASDFFVPVGSTFTVVFFEYLTLDPRGGEEHWVICPELMQRDSIWIRNGGTYVDTPRFVDELFTQRVRLAGAITQRRTGQSTWSTPKVTSRAGLTQGNWEADYVIEVPADTPCKAPSAVVIASNLSPAAKPSAVQDGGFYLDAAHLWSGGRDAVNAARAAPWNTDGATAPQEQFIIRALIATGKIKP
jgi:hypothetical protein